MYFNDLFYFDLDQKMWYDQLKRADLQPGSNEERPSPRTDHTVVLFEGSLYVFGGFDGKARYNDLYRCKLRDGKFKWK